MPDELGKYIQDFIRPIQLYGFDTQDEASELYDYFVNLNYKLNFKFIYKIGMVFNDDKIQYTVIEISKYYIIVECFDGLKIEYKKYKKKERDNKLKIFNLEHKSEKINRHIKINRMISLINYYMCLPRNTAIHLLVFYKMLINKRCKRFWTSQTY